MVDAYMAGDARFDGRFFTCVHTTGIYCYPSCRARKPKPENVSFVATVEEAQRLGFRACKRCKPNQPIVDPADLASTILRSIWEHPERFADTTDLQRLVGKKSSALAEFTRMHAQRAPLQLLNDARIAAAKRLLLGTNRSVGEIALEVGFESQSTFYEQFAKLVGMAPITYRGLTKANHFELALPVEQPILPVLKTLGRDPFSPTERVEGNQIVFSTRTGLARAEVGHGFVRCVTEGDALDAHGAVCRYFGFGQDAAAFAASLNGDALGDLVRKNAALRVPLTGDIFEAVLWSIIGQQINLPFAFMLRRRLYEKVGKPLKDGFYRPLNPADVAKIDASDLLSFQFSQRKAEYIVDTARLIEADVLSIHNMATESAMLVEKRLLAIRGLGPWSVNYIMMRGLGLSDCLPLGDTGLRAALERLHSADEKLSTEAVESLMDRYRPYRSLATYHLWQSLNMPG